MKTLRDSLEFTGHPLIRATHRTTFEVTKDSTLSERGDCIIGVNASKSGVDFDPSFKKMLSDYRTVVVVTIRVDEESFSVRARGHPALTLTHSQDLVVRRSSFICPRTLAVDADKAAVDIPRNLVSRLRDPHVKCLMEIELEGV